jgi:DNA-directed RNA polymerase specialized sigma24 family protein
LDIAKGDNEAVRKLCDDDFPKMVRLAQKRFRHQGVLEGAFDGEDAAIEAIYEFYEGMVQGKFPNISNREELRRLLVTITYRRVSWWRRHIATQKRGSGLVLFFEEPTTKKQPTCATIAALGIEAKDEDIQGGFAGIPDKKQQTPEEELIAAETYQQMLEQLPNEELRQVAILMMDGGSAAEIANTLGCTDQTVRNKRDKIRDNLLVKLMGTEPTSHRANEVVKKYQFLLDALDADRRPIAESWFKGDKPQEIAKKLGRSSTAIYNELLRIARIWENNR